MFFSSFHGSGKDDYLGLAGGSATLFGSFQLSVLVLPVKESSADHREGLRAGPRSGRYWVLWGREGGPGCLPAPHMQAGQPSAWGSQRLLRPCPGLRNGLDWILNVGQSCPPTPGRQGEASPCCERLFLAALQQHSGHQEGVGQCCPCWER